MNFDEVFRQATGYGPYPYQTRLAEAKELPQLLDIPTGLGKTAVVGIKRQLDVSKSSRVSLPEISAKTSEDSTEPNEKEGDHYERA
jgi:hypothetical protein